MTIDNSYIAVTKSSFLCADSVDLIEAHAESVRILLNDYCYELDEIPKMSAMAYLVQFYIEQVRNGGHGQFLGNGRIYKDFLDLVEEGLCHLKQSDILSVYRDFRAYLNIDHERADRIADGYGFGNIEPEIRKIDEKFLGLDENSLWDRLAEFLRYEANLMVVADDLFTATVESAGRLNPHVAERLRARTAARDIAWKQKRTAHSYFALANLLCHEAERQISHLTSGWQNGKRVLTAALRAGHSPG